MPYQNVKSCKIYVDWLQWYKSLGLIKASRLRNAHTTSHPKEKDLSALNSLIGLYPGKQVSFGNITTDDPGSWFNLWFNSPNAPYYFSFPAHSATMVGVLNHNLGFQYPHVYNQFSVSEGYKFIIKQYR